MPTRKRCTALRRKKHEVPPRASAPLTRGKQIAGQVAAMVGSWTFIIIQTALLLVCMALNVTAFIHRWDPYPFILLNLALSFPGGLLGALHHDEPEPPGIDRSSGRQT